VRESLQVATVDPLAAQQNSVIANGEQHWYALYTTANHEKKVAKSLVDRAVECYLPLYSSLRKWKDRRVRLEVPLFANYVFAKFAMPERLRVLQAPGVVRLVGFNGRAAVVPDTEVNRVRDVLVHGRNVEPHTFLAVGRRVRVSSGPLAGLEGILLRRKRGVRLVVAIESIVKSVSVEMDEADIVAA